VETQGLFTLKVEALLTKLVDKTGREWVQINPPPPNISRLGDYGTLNDIANNLCSLPVLDRMKY
jgi:hypothetical protein